MNLFDNQNYQKFKFESELKSLLPDKMKKSKRMAFSLIAISVIKKRKMLFKSSKS